ncbi:MAG: hypothetical protein AB7K86_09380 [Rhodospirillales bacterium]
MSQNDDRKRQRARNLALLAVLAALVVLFYGLTVVKFAGGGW